MRVSVCVPAFERPETTRLLIESFLAQDYADRELVIADDSRSDAVEQIVNGYTDDRIVYRRHHEPLGFCRNLKSALEQSSGQVAVILGDDDLLARADALSIYAASFASNPTVGYACANLVQIDGHGEVTLAYVAVAKTTVYEKGPLAVENLLLSSVHVTGIAFRRVPDLLELYPGQEMLFPQVKLASEMLSRHAGMAIGTFLTAARMHEGQLGFTAMKKPTRAGRPANGGTGRPTTEAEVGGQHGNVEVMQIIDCLREDAALPAAVVRTLERHYVKSYATNMVNEKINLGNWAVLAHIRLLRQYSVEAKRAYWLVLLCGVILALPRRTVQQLKLKLREVVASRMMSRYEPGRDWPLVGTMREYPRAPLE
jgi:hypothetical protein